MASLASQIRALRKMIAIPWRIVYVDKEVKREEFKEKTIYVHVWV